MPSDVVSTVADAKSPTISQNQDIAPCLELSADTYPDVLWSSPKAEIEVPLSMPIASGYVQGDVAIALSEARILSSKGIEEVDTTQSFITLPLLISNHVSAAIDISLTSAGLGDSSNNIRGKGGTSVAIETSSIQMLAELSPGCLSFPPAGYFTMHIVFPQYEANAIAHTPMLDHITLLNCAEINNGAHQIHEETVNTMPHFIASTEATSVQHRDFVASYVAEEEQDNQPHKVFSVTTTTNTMAAMQMPNQFLKEPTIDRDIGGQTSAILYDNPTCLYASAITESGSQQVYLSSYKACFLRHHGLLMPTQGPVVVTHMMCFDPGIFFDVWILHAVSRIVIVFLSWSKQREQVTLALSVISRQDGALSRAPFLLGHILPSPGILGDVSLRTIIALTLTSLCLLQYCRPWPRSIHYRVPIFVVAALLAQNTTVLVLQQAPLAISPVLTRVIHIISTSYISLLAKTGVPHSRDPKVIANTFTAFLCLEISVTGYKILDVDKSSFGWPLPTGFSVLGQSLCSDWHFTQGYYGGLWMQMATAARVPEARISLPTSPNLIGTNEFSVLMDVIQKLLQFLAIGQVSVIVEYIAVYPTSVFLLFVLMVRAGSILWLPYFYCNSSYLRYFVLDSGLALMCTIVAMDNVHSLWHISLLAHSLWHISLLARAKFTWHITFCLTELARAIIVHGLVYPKNSLDPFVMQALGVPQLAMISYFCFAPRVISFVILLCVAISQYFGTMIAGLHYRHLVKFPVPFTASVQDHSSPGHPTMFVEFYFRASLESITSVTNRCIFFCTDATTHCIGSMFPAY